MEAAESDLLKPDLSGGYLKFYVIPISSASSFPPCFKGVLRWLLISSR